MARLVCDLDAGCNSMDLLSESDAMCITADDTDGRLVVLFGGVGYGTLGFDDGDDCACLLLG